LNRTAETAGTAWYPFLIRDMSRGQRGQRGQHFREFQESEKKNPCPSESSLMQDHPYRQRCPETFSKSGRDPKTLSWLTTLSPSGFRGQKRFPGCPSRPTLSCESSDDTWHTLMLSPAVWRPAETRPLLWIAPVYPPCSLGRRWRRATPEEGEYRYRLQPAVRSATWQGYGEARKTVLELYSEVLRLMGIKTASCTQRRSFSNFLPHFLSRMDVDGTAALEKNCADPCTNKGYGDGAQREKRSNSRMERIVQTAVAATLRGARMEVPCKVGIVDILTDDLVIEVKYCTQWKQALGQCLAYRECFPNRQAKLVLFGYPLEVEGGKLDAIAETCNSMGVDMDVTTVSEDAGGRVLLHDTVGAQARDGSHVISKLDRREPSSSNYN
jgi:hypothetical protein